MSWRAPIGGETGSNQGLEKLGFPWILSFESSLFNGLRAIFCVRFFCARFLVIKAACAAPVGRFAPRSTPAADGAIFPESRSEIFSFNLSPVVRQCQSPAILRPSRGSGKKLSVILIHGLTAMVLRRPTPSTGYGRLRRRRWRCQTSADMAIEIQAASLGGLAMNFVR
jgi:hypothetical protein